MAGRGRNGFPVGQGLKAVRLLCILEHPTQYAPPLWAALARRAWLQPTVWYSRMCAPSDPEAKKPVHWGSEHGAIEVVADADLARRVATLSPKPDAILTPGWTRPRTWLAAHAARARGIPLLLPSDKTLNEPSEKQPLRTVLTMAHAVKARFVHGFLTTGTLGRTALQSVGVPADRIATGLYPVDVSWWDRQLAQQRALTESLRKDRLGAFVVLAVSKLHERENPLLVIEGFARLRRQLPSARLLFVGDGPLRGEVQRRIASLGLANDVTLAGYLPYAALAGFYGAADVFVHVPRREPWGISVLEAMACSLPVVAASTVGSAADLVISGRTGLLISPGDEAELGDALGRLAPSGVALEAGRRARRRVEALDVTCVAERLERLVEHIRRPVPKVALSDVLKEELLNRWGRWSE
jgi:glycosyltransferase involved in cell wall biosynthesis